MPNWCNNTVEISHTDPFKIKFLADAMMEGKFLSHVIPVPQELTDTMSGFLGDTEAQKELERKTAENVAKYGAGNWYDFCVSRWGTKWEVDCEGVDVSEDGLTVTANFDSAWSPPIGVYEELVDLGFQVKAMYFEPGMCFAGVWEDGIDDCYSEWGDSQGAKDTLPQELDDHFAISESQAEWEAENAEEEELTEWIKDGAEARATKVGE